MATEAIVADAVQPLVLAELERAELAARERRLAAVAEAEAILARAAIEAAEIERCADGRVAAALAALRRSHLERAEREIASIVAELAELEGRPERVVGAPRFEDAVTWVVAAVLGEEAGDRPRVDGGAREEAEAPHDTAHALAGGP